MMQAATCINACKVIVLAQIHMLSHSVDVIIHGGVGHQTDCLLHIGELEHEAASTHEGNLHDVVVLSGANLDLCA